MGHGGGIDTRGTGRCSSSHFDSPLGPADKNLYQQTTASPSHWNGRVRLVHWLYLGYTRHVVGAQLIPVAWIQSSKCFETVQTWAPCPVFVWALHQHETLCSCEIGVETPSSSV